MPSLSSSTTTPTLRTAPARAGRALGGALRAVGVLCSTLWLLGACCDPLDETCGVDPDEDAGPVDGACADGTDGTNGSCAIGNCDVATIEDVGGQTCATCPSDGADGVARICGEPVVARCESRENSRGQGCSICATDFGEILYDSCFTNTPVPVANCERSQEPFDPDAPGEPAEELVCETCTDEQGLVVSVTCEPASDECHEETNASGLTCRVCTRASADGGPAEVVVTACEQPDITPRSCEAYANELGRCIDCFGDDDELLTHFCTLTEDTFISCSESITPEGLSCTSCYDQNGAQTDRFCDEVDPTLEQCALLDYSEQSCVVCLGVDGSPASYLCERKDCDPANAEECLPPPECEFDFSADGALCRTCPTDAGALEQQCVFETNLQCEQIFDDNSQASCLSCKDVGSGVEVFRRCDTFLPPTCFNTENEAGELCEVCLDSQTGEQVYATCPSQTCYDVGDFNLFGVNGNTLFLDQAPAVASCSECAGAADDGVTTADDFQAICTLRTDCGPVDFASPDAACDGTVTFRLRPLLCDNPWELAGFSGFAASADELLQIMSFALDSGALGVIAVQHPAIGPATAPPECNDQCGCARGDVLEVVVRPNDANATVETFGGVLERCATDADCRDGNICRSDGGCG